MNPNATQVGGTHYRSHFQHWDLVARLKLGYFEGQVTKYVTRHRHKNGRQDLDKALHFLIKLLTLVEGSGWKPEHLFPTTAMLDEYSIANSLTSRETDVIYLICGWSSTRELKLAERTIHMLVQEHYGTSMHAPVSRTDADRLARIEGKATDDGSAPGPGYVNQDR